SCDKEKLACPAAHALEGLQKSLLFVLATVELLWDAKLAQGIALAEWKRRDGARRFEPLEAFAQIGLEPLRCPVTTLCRLGHELHHDVRHDRGDLRHKLRGRRRSASDMAVDELQGIRGREGHIPDQAFVKSHAQGIEVRAMVDGTVHPARLLG